MSFFRRSSLTAALMASLALAVSCIGIDARTTIGKNGSGRLHIDYQIASELLKFGELEANSPKLPLPVSREDFERTVAGSKELSLAGYRQTVKNGDMTVSVDLDFATPAALVRFLDPRGERASFSAGEGKSRLSLVLSGGNPSLDPDVSALLKEACGSATIKLAFKLPSAPISSTVSGAVGTASTKGSTVEYTTPMADLAVAPAPVSWEIIW